jgi:hypothetical protein
MHHIEPIESAYFNWLCAKVMQLENPTPSLTYWNLLRELQNTEFLWVVEMDENRAIDGKELRHEFVNEARVDNFDPVWLEIGCSVLEMLIAVSRRTSFIDDRSPREWFWEMLNNTGLSEFKDSNFRQYLVDDIIHRLVWRLYEYDGRGGLFPLIDPPHDQRKVEIWYQFCDYLEENS